VTHMTRMLTTLAALALFAGQAAGQTESPVELATPTGVIHGTLLLPAGPGRHPVALLISGSGPTDRNGNTMGMGPNNSLKLLAEALAANGVASVRYDKRAIGESAPAAVGGEAALRFESYIDDGAGWIRQLRADPRFDRVAVIGHSEGSLIGMVAARAAGADRFVSVAGVGHPAGVVIRDQLRPQLPAPLYAQADSVLLALEAGHTFDNPPAELIALFRPSVQPYFISWLKYDPAVEIARLSIPTLILQGTTDIQVQRSEAEALSRGMPAARLVMVEGMNHVLKEVPADRARQIASYTDATLPVAPRLVTEIVAFLRAN
jgi:pimeloyl-ACP methyl ester carboxylesterase